MFERCRLTVAKIPHAGPHILLPFGRQKMFAGHIKLIGIAEHNLPVHANLLERFGLAVCVALHKLASALPCILFTASGFGTA